LSMAVFARASGSRESVSGVDPEKKT